MNLEREIEIPKPIQERIDWFENNQFGKFDEEIFNTTKNYRYQGELVTVFSKVAILELKLKGFEGSVIGRVKGDMLLTRSKANGGGFIKIISGESSLLSMKNKKFETIYQNKKYGNIEELKKQRKGLHIIPNQTYIVGEYHHFLLDLYTKKL